MIKRLMTLGFASVLSIAAIVGLRADSSAGGLTFANNILNGSYSLHDAGSANLTIGGNSFDEDFDDVGVINWDQKGHCSGSVTVTYRIPFSSGLGG